MVEIRRKDKESVGGLLRRFTRKMQLAGVLLEARKHRFHRPKPTRRSRRLSALRREKVKRLRDKLLKLGLLEEGKEIPQDVIRKYLRDEQIRLH